MDIESKAYRIRSAFGNVVEVIHKATGRAVFPARADVPSLGALTHMTESQFDRAMAHLIGEG